MFSLRAGYFISGITTGLLLLFSFITSLPDGKLHIYVCDVGQGDGAYIRFPDGKDMVVDGGPTDSITKCLGKYMPFWDRHIDMVVMTHPQKDHMQGLISVFARYKVDYFLRSEVDNTTEGYKALLDEVELDGVQTKFIIQGDIVDIGGVTLEFLWPSGAQIAQGNGAPLAHARIKDRVLGSQDALGNGATVGDLNDYSLVFWLRYGSFDGLFTGDADTRVEHEYNETKLADGVVELLKVPHHGSKTGMSQSFVQWLKPKLAVISVGKNNYGHPSAEVLGLLQSVSSQIARTDKNGDVKIVSDGRSWKTD